MPSDDHTSIEWSVWARFSPDAVSAARAVAVRTQMAAGWRLRYAPEPIDTEYPWHSHQPWVLEFHPFMGRKAEEL